MPKFNFIDELNYHSIKRLIQKLFKSKILTEKEYTDLLQRFKEKYHPMFDILTD